MQPVVVAVTSWSLWKAAELVKKRREGKFCIDGWYPSMTSPISMSKMRKNWWFMIWYWWFPALTMHKWLFFLWHPLNVINGVNSEIFRHQLGWDVSVTALERPLMPTIHKHNLRGCATMPWTLLRRSYRAYPASQFHVAGLGDFGVFRSSLRL